MLTTLLAWIYITLLCWMWGNLFFLSVKKIIQADLQVPHLSIICITGLATITVIAGILSLFIPLGGWWVQLLFIAPCLILFLRKDSQRFVADVKKEFQPFHPLSAIFLSACLLLILVMSTWTVIHPDTLGYHAQTMQWIEKYKVVPGLVHLHFRFGLQGLWFVDCALFNFSFTGKGGITFLNSTVLLWFFIFITNRINFSFFKEGKKIYGLLWMALLVLSVWSYTQVRLTATSASADFIATIFIWTILYLLLEKLDASKKTNTNEWFLVAFLGVVAVTIKLSAAPLLLITGTATIIFLKRRKIKLLFALLIISAISLFPFIARNIITSGYIVFPLTAIDVVNVDWKYSQQLTTNEKKYITAYAKNPGIMTPDEIDAVVKSSLREWIPGWWQNRSMADKVILILLMVCLFVALLSIRKIIRSGSIAVLIFITLLAAIIFWFVNAPDPRFGFGQIIGFIAAVAYLVFLNKHLSFNKSVLLVIVIFASAVISTYTVYRFMNFFQRSQLLSPLGIEKIEFSSFHCNGLKFNKPAGNHDFGNTPVPCTDLNCEDFISRGSNIKDGFRAKSNFTRPK